MSRFGGEYDVVDAPARDQIAKARCGLLRVEGDDFGVEVFCQFE